MSRRWQSWKHWDSTVPLSRVPYERVIFHALLGSRSTNCVRRYLCRRRGLSTKHLTGRSQHRSNARSCDHHLTSAAWASGGGEREVERGGWASNDDDAPRPFADPRVRRRWTGGGSEEFEVRPMGLPRPQCFRNDFPDFTALFSPE